MGMLRSRARPEWLLTFSLRQVVALPDAAQEVGDGVCRLLPHRDARHEAADALHQLREQLVRHFRPAVPDRGAAAAAAAAA